MGSSASKTVDSLEPVTDKTSAVNHSVIGNRISKHNHQHYGDKNAAMGTRAAKEHKANVAEGEHKQGNFTKEEIHFIEWKQQTTSIVEKLQSEAIEKDNKIKMLAQKAKDATDKYEKQKFNRGQPNSDTLLKQREHIKALEERLKEKDCVIKSLQRQLLQSRNDKESQVSVVKDTVEMVIREKDSEIRRLKALWSPAENQEDGVTSSEDEASRANKMLHARSLTGQNNTRFGISAENRSSKSIDLKSIPKTNAQRTLIRKALNANVFLKGLDTTQVDKVVECMSRETVSTGKNVITEGQSGSHVFILERGEIEVYHTKGDDEIHVANLKPGTVFGELAILYNCKRTASVRAKTEVSLWSLERNKFQSVVKQSGQEKRIEYVRVLRSVEKLKSLSDNKLMRIADCLEEAHFHAGNYIIRQGDSGDTFYIIQDGQVKVTQNKTAKLKSDVVEEEFVCYMKTGEYFGELALLTEDKRAANVIAGSDDVTVLMLDRQAFNSLVGTLAEVARSPSFPNIVTSDHSEPKSPTQGELPTVLEEGSEDEDIEDVLHENLNNLSVRVTITSRLSKATEEVLKRTDLNQLKVLRILGQGGFGCVKLVRAPGLPKCALALKCIRKAKILKTGQQQHVLAERNIMLAMKSPFIGRLYRTYKDEKIIYMLMDAYLGGEIYNELKKRGPLCDDTARFTSACVLEALAYLHERGIVYRDLKPENLMLDHKGYVKLVDFGFAKRIRFGFKTWTFCGTPEYFPPEILSNCGHDFSADYWSFGILIYELMTRTTPFYGPDDMTVYENILDGIEGVKFSKRISKSAEVLIRGLCKLEARDRLGYQRGGVNDIRKQRWYQGFDWQGLRMQRIIAPFNPNVKSPHDTKNFEECVEDFGDLSEEDDLLANAKPGWDETF